MNNTFELELALLTLSGLLEPLLESGNAPPTSTMMCLCGEVVSSVVMNAAFWALTLRLQGRGCGACV